MTARPNMFAGQPDPWTDEADEATPRARSQPMNLRRAIGYFADVEAQCDAAIQEQDALIREVTRRIPGPGEAIAQADAYVPLTAETPPREDLRASDMPYEAYREISKLANRVMEKQMPMATRRFMSRAGRTEVDRIEELEIDIGSLRQRMRDVEHHILNHTPQTAEEVALKLKFLASLLIDGGEIEVDFFAYLVEESAEILEAALQDEGAA